MCFRTVELSTQGGLGEKRGHGSQSLPHHGRAGLMGGSAGEGSGGRCGNRALEIGLSRRPLPHKHLYQEGT